MTTWTAGNGKLWLRDFLPSQLPKARIMSFSYNSDTALSKAVTDIDDMALKLLHTLNLFRQLAEERKRPIIFISHSLGGIVVKKAGFLLFSSNGSGILTAQGFDSCPSEIELL